MPRNGYGLLQQASSYSTLFLPLIRFALQLFPVTGRCDILDIMSEIISDGLNPIVAGLFVPFAAEILKGYDAAVHSIYVVGSAVTTDYNERTSDINSLIVLRDMDFASLEFIASLGNKFRKKGIAAPLTMTPAYIDSSLDVFPMEFLDLKNIHVTVCGDDILKDLRIDDSNLRLQCEREVKSKLINLRHGYVSSLGERKSLSEQLTRTVYGYVPLFRAIIHLMGKASPVEKHKVVVALRDITGIETDIFEKIMLVKKKAAVFSKEEIASVFKQYYIATEKLAGIVDGLQT